MAEGIAIEQTLRERPVRRRSGTPSLVDVDALAEEFADVGCCAHEIRPALHFVLRAPVGAKAAAEHAYRLLGAHGGTTIPTGLEPDVDTLTGREREVLALTSGSASNHELALVGHLSAQPFTQHLMSINGTPLARNPVKEGGQAERLGPLLR